MNNIDDLSENKNPHVYRLHRFLPFSPVMDQIFEEYTATKDSLNLATRALNYLLEALQKNARLIILTGDAGHGKTHLCRRLLQDHLSYTEDEARQLINDSCDGSRLIPHRDGNKSKTSLRIYKDFSEFAVSLAANEIEKTASRDSEVCLICANEGRLRAVMECSSAGDVCSRLLQEFKKSFEEGLASSDGLIHVINLNFQSVAMQGGNSLVTRTLQEWLSGNRWRSCKDCSVQCACPIYRNRNLLAPNADPLAERRRSKLEGIYATAERLGVVITIREMLMSIAYLITGGLNCEEVAKKCRKKMNGWQPPFAFYNLLFEPPDRMIKEKLSKIPVVLELARLDPGERASREVDERLINQQGQFKASEIDIIFEDAPSRSSLLIDASNGIDDIVGNPRSRTDRQNEATLIRRVLKSLRRRAFFDEDLDEAAAIKRLGFDNGGDFLEIIAGSLSPAKMATMKSRVLSGLHMIQGLQLGSRETNLHLVDPAFGRATSHAAIIARRIRPQAVKLIPMREKWSHSGEKQSQTTYSAVDWLERHIILRIEEEDKTYSDFPLDLMLFDCITKAGGGYVAEEFYAHDVRRVGNFFGRLAEKRAGNGSDISLFLHGKIYSVSIDDGVIQVGGGY